MLIRGERILNQLLDETTYQELENKTLAYIPPSVKRQYAVDPIQIVQLKLLPYRNSNVLEAHAIANSEGMKYEPSIMFNDVMFEDGDQNDNVSFVGSDKEEHHIMPIQLNQSNVKVRCTCLDFRWRFALWNSKDGSLLGEPPGPYQKKTDRPPVNPQRVPGICKHLMKTMIALKQAGLVA